MNRRVVIVSIALALILSSPGKSRAEKVCGGWNNKAHCGAAACAGLPIGSACGGGMVCYDLGECKEDSDFRYCGCGLGREVPGQAIAPQASLKTTRTLKATLVGFVLPRDTHPGDRVSVGVVLNPKTYSALHGLRVVTAEVLLPESERGHATLNGVVVRPEKAERQAASEGVTYPVPRDAASIALTIAAVEHIDQPTVVSVPIESSIPAGEPAPEQKPGEFTMAPVLTDSPVALVHGPFNGYGGNTRVEV